MRMMMGASPKFDGKRLARSIKAARQAAGLSGAQLASRLGWSAAKVSRLQNEEECPFPNRNDLKRLAGVLTNDATGERALEAEFLRHSGYIPGEMLLFEEIERQFVARLKEIGVPEDLLPNAMAQVSADMMRRVMAGEEEVEFRRGSDVSPAEITRRRKAGEQVVTLDTPLESFLAKHAQNLRRDHSERIRARAEEPVRRFLAGEHAEIVVRKELTDEQVQALRHAAELVKALLKE